MSANRGILAAALLLGLTACASAAEPPAPTTPSPTPSSAFGGTDLAWIEITIAMDEELLPLLDLVPQRAGKQALVDLSTQVKAFTIEELGRLRQLHDEAGLPSANPHEGMPMPGMVTPSLLASASGQRGSAFDHTLATSLREHLEQGRKLATSEQAAGSETRTKTLAARIVETRAAALEALQRYF